MATLWGFESLPGHQATLNADCPAPSIKTKTYTPGAIQLHTQRKKLRLSSHNPRHFIRPPPIREFSRNLRQAVPSAHFIPLSNSSTALRLLSFRAVKPRRSPAALQHVLQHISKHAGCSYASLHRAQGRYQHARPVWRPQTSARTKQRLLNHVISNPNCALNPLRTPRQGPNRGSFPALF